MIDDNEMAQMMGISKAFDISKTKKEIQEKINQVMKKHAYEIQEEGEEGYTAGYVNGFSDGAKYATTKLISVLEDI